MGVQYLRAPREDREVLLIARRADWLLLLLVEPLRSLHSRFLCLRNRSFRPLFRGLLLGLLVAPLLVYFLPDSRYLCFLILDAFTDLRR